jgi:hypothetical protein
MRLSLEGKKIPALMTRANVDGTLTSSPGKEFILQSLWPLIEYGYVTLKPKKDNPN